MNKQILGLLTFIGFCSFADSFGMHNIVIRNDIKNLIRNKPYELKGIYKSTSGPLSMKDFFWNSSTLFQRIHAIFYGYEETQNCGLISFGNFRNLMSQINEKNNNTIKLTEVPHSKIIEKIEQSTNPNLSSKHTLNDSFLNNEGFVVINSGIETPKLNINSNQIFIAKSDINTGKEWLRLSESEIKSKLNDAQQYLKIIALREFFIAQPNVPSKGKVLFLYVHGTFANDKPDFFDIGNKAWNQKLRFSYSYPGFQHYTKHVVSVGWSGYNNDSSRTVAGNDLVALVEMVGHNYDKIVLLTHSHGGNVVHYANNILMTTKHAKKIDCIYNFATPIIDWYQGKCTELWQLYSFLDLVQTLGGMVNFVSGPRGFFKQESGRKASDQNVNSEDSKIYNVRVLINGTEPNHTDIKTIVPALHMVKNIIKEKFPNCYDFDINVALNIKTGKLIWKKDEAKNFICPVIVTTQNEKYLANASEEIKQFNEAERLRYKQEYKHSINDKGWIVLSPIRQILGLKQINVDWLRPYVCKLYWSEVLNPLVQYWESYISTTKKYVSSIFRRQ